MVLLGGLGYGHQLQVEVIEYWEKPKSLQVVSGNGSTSQTISTLNFNNVEIEMNSYQHDNYGLAARITAIATNSVTWSDNYRCGYVLPNNRNRVELGESHTLRF